MTRAWFRSAYEELATGSGPLSQRFLKHAQQTRVTIAVVKAVVNLIFDPPVPAASAQSTSVPSSGASSPVSSAASSAASTPVMTPAAPSAVMSSSRSRSPGSSAYANYPETLFLDYGRLTTLSTDAADFTALYMLLMLYRQLVHSHLHRLPRSQAQPQASAVSTEELVRLKKEIWEIGPAHPGLCFMQHRPRSSGGSGSGSGSSSRSSSRHERGDRDREAEMRRWRGEIGDVVLQVTMRAAEPRAKPRSPPSSAAGAPDAGTLGLSGSWAESNLRAGSPLSALMKRRVRECVEEAVLNIVLPPPASPASSPSAPSPSDAAERENDGGAATPPPPPTSNGLEPLMPEIRHLAERAAKLVQIHTNVYGGLYAHPSFLGADGEGVSAADATAAALVSASATAAATPQAS